MPGGGGFATASALTLFYQALLIGGNEHTTLWPMETLLDARRIRTGDMTDMMFKKPANRALGLIISGDKSRSFRGFGKTNSPEAFGHNGAGGQRCGPTPPPVSASLTYPGARSELGTTGQSWRCDKLLGRILRKRLTCWLHCKGGFHMRYPVLNTGLLFVASAVCAIPFVSAIPY